MQICSPKRTSQNIGICSLMIPKNVGDSLGFITEMCTQDELKLVLEVLEVIIIT